MLQATSRSLQLLLSAVSDPDSQIQSILVKMTYRKNRKAPQWKLIMVSWAGGLLTPYNRPPKAEP